MSSKWPDQKTLHDNARGLPCGSPLAFVLIVLQSDNSGEPLARPFLAVQIEDLANGPDQ
ncbi:hypothetical protein ACSSVV_000755 [Marinobacter sp. MBR-105]|jgi:hypothetical protein